jgi:hypothetical protein
MNISSRGFRIRAATGIVASLVWTLAAAETEVRPLSGFSAIGVSGGIDLNIRQGDEFLVEAVNSGGSPEDIVTTVEDGTLTIRRNRSEGWFDWFDDYSVNVTLPELSAIQSSGGSEVRIDGTITGDELGISASGGSDIVAVLDVTNLAVSSSGGADLTLSGAAVSVTIQASGGSDIDARELSTERATIQSSGGADIDLGVSGQLVAQASGGSDISYFGDPTTDIAVSGGADVTQR